MTSRAGFIVTTYQPVISRSTRSLTGAPFQGGAHRPALVPGAPASLRRRNADSRARRLARSWLLLRPDVDLVEPDRLEQPDRRQPGRHQPAVDLAVGEHPAAARGGEHRHAHLHAERVVLAI